MSDQTAADIWVEIHFKENSIPSIIAGQLTANSRKQLYDLCVAALPKKTEDTDMDWDNAIDQSIEALAKIFGQEKA